MKKTKRLFSLLLALMMVLAMGTAALADDNDGKIIISNPQADASYTAYKVFDVTYDAEEHYAYTATTAVKDFLTGHVTGLEFTENVADNSWNVKLDANFSPAAMAQYIKENLTTFQAIVSGTAFTADGDTMVADNLARGYYFVSSSQGAICELTTAKTVTIKDKNETPDIVKTVDDEDRTVEVGQVLTFNIKGTVPTTTGYTKYVYKVSDSMSTGLTFNKDVKVYIDGAVRTESATIVMNNDSFTVELDMTKFQDKVDKLVNIEYTATVNENAITKNIETNTAKLIYSNDPANSTSTDETEEKIVKLYSYNIVLDKYKSGETTKKLSGAKFVLKNSDGTKYYQYDATNKKVNWVSNKAQATEVTTDSNGVARFDGLEAGSYMLEETEAPKGYNLLPKDSTIKIVISGSDEHSATLNDEAAVLDTTTLSVTAPIANSTGSKLPETGNTGTMIFIVLGGLAVIIAGVFLVTNKRMSKESF